MGPLRALPLAAIFAAAAASCTDLGGLAGEGLAPLPDGGRPTKDAGSRIGDAGSVPDEPASTGRCDPDAPFGAPELAADFDPQADYVKGAVLSPDEREAFYLRYDKATSDWELRHARRTSRDAAWGAPVTDTMVPSPDGFLSLTAGGKKLYFWTLESNHRATRADTSSAFGAPSAFDVKGGPAPHVVDADDTAYFARYEGDATVVRRIRRASVNTNGFSNTSSYVPNVWVDGASDGNPVLNRSETIMYFSSNRPGGRGLADVWVARRPSKQDEFGPGTHVRELSTDEPDQVTWVSDDDCVVMLDRASHVYVARRPAP